jgi:hypothetical protein
VSRAAGGKSWKQEFSSTVYAKPNALTGTTSYWYTTPTEGYFNSVEGHNESPRNFKAVFEDLGGVAIGRVHNHTDDGSLVPSAKDEAVTAILAEAAGVGTQVVIGNHGDTVQSITRVGKDGQVVWQCNGLQCGEIAEARASGGQVRPMVRDPWGDGWTPFAPPSIPIPGIGKPTAEGDRAFKLPVSVRHRLR